MTAIYVGTFYYKEFEEGKPPIVRPLFLNVLAIVDLEVQSAFQSYLVTATLATHFSAISGTPTDQRVTNWPVGALVLTLLAVSDVDLFLSRHLGNDLSQDQACAQLLQRGCQGGPFRFNWIFLKA